MEMLARLWDHPWVITPVTVAIAITLALIAHRIVFLIIERAMPRRLRIVRQTLVRRVKRPALYMLPALAVFAVIPTLPLPDQTIRVLDYISGLGVIAIVGWAAAIGI